MNNVINDIKIIFIVLICTVLYPILINGKVNLVETINTLLIITFSICLSTIIITYYSNKKYLNSLYKCLSISFFGIGVVFLTFINIIKKFVLDTGFWIHAIAFNTILSIFESLLLLFSIYNYNKKIRYNTFLLITVILSLFISFMGSNYFYTVEKFFSFRTFEVIRVTGRTIALILKLWLLIAIIKKSNDFIKGVYNSFIIFTVLRILLHILGFVGHRGANLGMLYLCCILITVSNYYIVKIMVIEIIRNPQEYLYEELIKKTIKLEDTIKQLTEVNNEKEIIENNYEKKTYKDKVKTEILTNLSHEFKTPVNVIYAAIQTEQLNKENFTAEEFTKYNSIIKQNCNRLIRIINNFIDVNKFERGKSILKLKCYNIVYITESLVDAVRPYAESKKLNMVFDTSDEVLYCELDFELYERAILNILSNSIKYTNIESEVLVNIEKINKNIQISIEDSGIGMSEEELNTIFIRFERVDKTFSRDTEGVGLGLNIVKEIVELHKGTIKILSEKKIGTKVIVTLPVFFGATEEKYDYVSINESIKYKAEVEMSDIYFT